MGEGIIDHWRPLGFVTLEPRGLGNRVNIYEHGQEKSCSVHHT